jgi:exopolysaccharide production protein ExoQ
VRLFYRDYQRREPISNALWLPLLWTFIISSRPISVWFGYGAGDAAADPLEGSPADSFFFQLLILAGIVVLVRRRIDWSGLFRNNRWLVIFFLYLGVSVLWSDFPIVSLKRWIKDLGNVIMVLIVLSDEQPVRAARILLARCCYLLIPLSVLLIKYFPELGRYYDRWNGTAYYTGVTLDKNLLGMTLFGCGLALVWMLFDQFGKKTKGKKKLDWLVLLFLSALAVWLLHQAHSSTALACTVLGSLTFLGMRFTFVRKKLKHFWAYSALTIVLFLFVNTVFDVQRVMPSLLGRDMSLTGRTDIWTRVLKEGTDPLIGTGFYSFWSADRTKKISADFHYELNEAHNGYLETYLNSGLIGVFLLFAVIISAGNRIKMEAIKGDPFAAFRLAGLLAVIPYGMTEAIFNRLSLIWFLFLLVVIEYPRRFRRGATLKSDTYRASSDRPKPVRDPAARLNAANDLNRLELCN